MSKAFIIMLLCGVCTLTAQEEQATSPFHHQIGVAGSLISGMGISYQYIFSDDYRVKCTGLYYSQTNGFATFDERNSTDIQAGMEVQKSLYLAKSIRVFAFAGVGMLRLTDRTFDVTASLESNYRTHMYNGGAGVGVELIAIGRVAFNIEVGGMYYVENRSGEFDSPKHSVYETFSRREVGLGIGGGLGIGYRF